MIPLEQVEHIPSVLFLVLYTPCNMLPCNFHEALKGLAVYEALTIIYFG